MEALNWLPPNLPPARVVARIGLISDTHIPQRCAALPASLATIFAGVDLILHAGDLGELWVLNELSKIAPVVAVHGNDETAAAQRELPYQQVITVAGQRILLWHSHYPDRVDELHSRRGDEIRAKLERSFARGQRSGARIVVFGHWHIPILLEDNGVLAINPGALASGSGFTRQLQRSVALLFLRDDGQPFVRFVDVDQPERSLTPWTGAPDSFETMLRTLSASIVAPEIEANRAALMQQLEAIGLERLMPAYLRLAHRCWAGELALITKAVFLAELDGDEELSPHWKAPYRAVLENLPAP